MFGRPGDLSACVDALGHLDLHVRPLTRNLGVIYYSAFKFEKQISSVVKAKFCCWLKSSPTCRVRSLKV